MQYSPDLKRVLAGARTYAMRCGDTVIDSIDLLRAILMYARDINELLQEPNLDGMGLLEDLGVDKEWAQAVRAGERPDPVDPPADASPIRFSDNATLVFRELTHEASQAHATEISTTHLLMVLYRMGGKPTQFLKFFSFRPRGEQYRDAWLVRLDTSSKQPYFDQLVARIQEAVAIGELSVGDKLPPVRQLAASLAVAPGTVARAYAYLERQGILETQRALGTRVAESGQAAAAPAARRDRVAELLHRPVIEAFHLGATADELREVLEEEIRGVRL
jgi:GntR family transcriptional regulator